MAAAARRTLAHAPAQARLDRTTIAGILGPHPHMLQRQLDEEAASFDALRDEVRREAAPRYLARSPKVAGLVGSSEQSAFTR